MSDPGAGGAVRRWRAPDVLPGSGHEGCGRMLTAERLATIEEQARAEGHRRGLEEGRAAGRGECERLAARMRELVDSIRPQVAVLDEPLIEQLGALVMAIARQFIRRELSEQSGEVVRVVREALGVLPVNMSEVRILLHPDDAAVVRDVVFRQRLERPIEIVEDVTLTPGGAMVETEVSVVDATVESRLNAIAAQLFGNRRADDLAGPTPCAEHDRDDT